MGLSSALTKSGGAGGSALLLRLFESDFFNVHLAVGYLKTYPNSIGITHYLVRRLSQFEREDVEFYWPQLCYLVITRPTPSVALENFILDRCQSDAHIAVITLWYLQSSLSDLALNPASDQFGVCRRLFNRVQSIIFTDPPFPSSTESSSSSSFLNLSLLRQKEKVNAPLASVVGMGLLAAGVGQPVLVASEGQVVLDQGRSIEYVSKATVTPALGTAGEEDEDSNSGDEDHLAPSAHSTASRSTAAPSKSKPQGKTKPVAKRTQTEPPNYVPGAPLGPSPESAFAAFKSKPFSAVKSSLDSIRTSATPSSAPTTPQVNGKGSPNPSWSAGSPTFGKRKVHLPQSSTTPSLSVPSLPYTSPSAPYLSGASPNSSSTALNVNHAPGYGLPPAFLSHLLLLQACREQLDLLRSLQDISTRLVLVPKPARLSSLRAELTVLNHGLPRGCSLGMESRPDPAKAKTKGDPERPPPHARIVRISPSESVVLNSADRAPFVIHVEVLEGDLDFDPARRQNAEDLRRALREREAGGAGAVSHPPPRVSIDSRLDELRSSQSAVDMRRSLSNSPRPASPVEGDISLPAGGFIKAPSPRPDVFEPEDEVDLVEQLYGGGAIKDVPIDVPDAEGQPIHNKTVDEQAWAVRKSLERKDRDELSAAGGLAPGHSAFSTSSPKASPSISRANSTEITNTPTTSTPVTPTSAKPGGRSIATRPPISLDDYAERMRMAAIMLAQLDASQQASMGVVATGSAAVGTVVGLPGATVAGIGGVVGAGLGAVASRLPFQRSALGVGQGTAGVLAPLDTASAASGTSAVSGQPGLNTGAVHRDSTSGTATPPPASAPAPAAPRQRLLAPADAAAIRERIMSEMMALEEERMERMKLDGKARSSAGSSSRMRQTSSGPVDDGAVVMRAVNKDDPSGAVFRESFAGKTARIRAASPYGHLANWNVISVIVKTGADLRQEQLAIQLVKEFGRIWQEEKCPSWVCYFRILVTSESSGLIETITDAVSVHSIKKDAYARTAEDGSRLFNSFTLYDHYVEAFGPPESSGFRKAQTNFINSLASYSVICYLLQLKDRHNGNILVDKDGHIIHIDFGFLLSNSPGSIGFEMAPFKLPQDYIDILGGYDSPKFAEFKKVFKENFRKVRKHAERIITLVELMQKDSALPCFANGEQTSALLRERFALSLTQEACDEYAEKLIVAAATSSFTRLYDLFQGYSNGIL